MLGFETVSLYIALAGIIPQFAAVIDLSGLETIRTLYAALLVVLLPIVLIVALIVMFIKLVPGADQWLGRLVSKRRR